MEQLNLLDWLNSKKIILDLPPTEHIQHRTFIINQLKPIFAELEALELSDGAISEAMAHYQNHYQEKHQKTILRATKEP